MILLSFYLFGKLSLPEGRERFPWEYFVPAGGRYDWRVAEGLEGDSKSHDFDLNVEGVESRLHADTVDYPAGQSV